MRRRLAALCLAVAFVSAPAVAQTEPAPPEQTERDCFRVDDVHGWGLIDSRTVRVRINSQRQYALTTDRNARRLRWSMGIALTSPSGWVCVGDAPAQAEIHEVGPVTANAWFVESVVALPDETAAAQGEQAAETASANVR
jgi:hypothetical protein